MRAGAPCPSIPLGARPGRGTGVHGEDGTGRGGVDNRRGRAERGELPFLLLFSGSCPRGEGRSVPLPVQAAGSGCAESRPGTEARGLSEAQGGALPGPAGQNLPSTSPVPGARSVCTPALACCALCATSTCSVSPCPRGAGRGRVRGRTEVRTDPSRHLVCRRQLLPGGHSRPAQVLRVVLSSEKQPRDPRAAGPSRTFTSGSPPSHPARPGWGDRGGSSTDPRALPARSTTRASSCTW